MPKRLYAANDNHFKRQKAPNDKAQGTGRPQFNCPMAVSQKIDVDNIKHTITLNQVQMRFADMSAYLVNTRRC